MLNNQIHETNKNNRKLNNQQIPYFKDIITSASASGIAEVLTLPICTIKTNYQNTNSISILHVTKDIWNRYGIKGFYNASGWAISSQMLSTAIKYTLYQSLNKMIGNYFVAGFEESSLNRTISNFVAGAVSGALASLVTHPFDVVKIHFQMHTSFLIEFKKHGPGILYQGYTKTLSKSVLGSILFFPLYDTFNGYFHNPSIAALGSATISTTIMQPIDYMKTRHIYNQPYFHTKPLLPMTNALYLIDIKPYFKGLSINLARVVPHFVITMTAIETFKRLF
ncbi:Mitochondrial carrier protein [uncultured virus]|nr:Mitochondrial carrier protein [uncultured virus]